MNVLQRYANSTRTRYQTVIGSCRLWADWDTAKARYRSADAVPGNRVVFNIKGNNYRLIVKIHYNTGRVFIRFVGTHAEYNKIDAETI